jgi:hypothetical protein
MRNFTVPDPPRARAAIGSTPLLTAQRRARRHQRRKRAERIGLERGQAGRDQATAKVRAALGADVAFAVAIGGKADMAGWGRKRR